MLADADRSTWDRDAIAEGLALVDGLAVDRAGPLARQAAIAAEHARAATFDDTDWRRILGQYDALLTADPSATIAVGRCVALSYVLGPAAGLDDLEAVLALGGLDGYPYAYAARAQLLDRLDRPAEAAASWQSAASSARTDAERQWFTGRSVRTLR